MCDLRIGRSSAHPLRWGHVDVDSISVSALGRASLDMTRAPALPRIASARFWEIDLARTIAIAMMVAYHSVYDIELLVPGLGPDPFRGPWGWLPEATGSLFLSVAGVSLAVVDGRLRARGATRVDRLRRHLRHALVVLSAAMLVTLATRVAFDERYVRFGILHMIGLAIVIGAVSVAIGRWNLVLGTLVILAGVAIAGASTQSPLLGILGFDQVGFSSVDHWPVLPWLGPMLIGIGAGTAFYPGGRRAPALAARLRTAPSPRFAAPGRYSLVIYLGHQLVLIPVVWSVLVVAGAEPPWPI